MPPPGPFKGKLFSRKPAGGSGGGRTARRVLRLGFTASLVCNNAAAVVRRDVCIKGAIVAASRSVEGSVDGAGAAGAAETTTGVDGAGATSGGLTAAV